MNTAHRIGGVADQVHEHLLQQNAVATDCWQAICQIQRDVQVTRVKLRLASEKRVTD